VSRVQLALNVNDIDEAVAFCTKLFGTEPAKRRPGYANFAVEQPPLKLVLLENPGEGGTLSHLGIEVSDIGTVDTEQIRLAAAGLASTDERDTTCTVSGPGGRPRGARPSPRRCAASRSGTRSPRAPRPHRRPRPGRSGPPPRRRRWRSPGP